MLIANSNYPQIMGILNVTPDSFYDGKCYQSIDAVLHRVAIMISEGVDIIDIGGESTRPYATHVSADEELQRVIPALAAIKNNFPIKVSIDTSKPEVMREAIACGVDLINDVRALELVEDLQFLAESKVDICLMHMQGKPQDMQDAPHYQNVIVEVKDYLFRRINFCESYGINQSRLILDPGFGFGKNLAHNLELLRNLHEFVNLNCPLLVGISRKRMIGEILDLDVEHRLYGSLAAHVVAVMHGAKIIRTHDIAATKQACTVAAQVMLEAEDCAK